MSETFIWLDDLQTPTDSPFCIDRRADRANWEYKSLYRGDIARYKRNGGSCLGLDVRMQAVNWNDGGAEKKRVEEAISVLSPVSCYSQIVCLLCP